MMNGVAVALHINEISTLLGSLPATAAAAAVPSGGSGAGVKTTAGRATRERGAKRAATTAAAAAASNDGDEAAGAAAAYVAQLKPLQMDEAVDLSRGHSFHKLAAGGGGGARGSRLLREVSALATALPINPGSSVWVRYDPACFNTLRACIAGPEGTPYSAGLFFFDIFLPASFPAVPPKVQFLTTGHGRVRFNPNLYECGKVCLSLLGTWAGPGWIPNKSTLIQVLVSIQSLILVEQPYFNEPSFEQSMGTAAGTKLSGAYNSVIRRATVTHAMVRLLLLRFDVDS
jgi:ubiquitin-protein ligase